MEKPKHKGMYDIKKEKQWWVLNGRQSGYESEMKAGDAAHTEKLRPDEIMVGAWQKQ